jgi:hypothetical protein
MRFFLFFFGGRPLFEPYVPFPLGMDHLLFYHFALLAQYAALIFPLAIFFLCLALKDLARLVIVLSPVTPCCPNRIVFTLPPSFATTTWDLVGWEGVLFGLLYPDTPTRFNLGSADFPLGISFSCKQG